MVMALPPWISRQFRDEFRHASHWLNERTDSGVQYFGVELAVLQIGESGPSAPVFEVVSRPTTMTPGGRRGQQSATVNEIASVTSP